MATETLEQLRSEFKEVESELIEVVQKQDEEIKRLGGTSTETSETLKSLESRYDKLEGYITEAQQKTDEVKEQLGELSNEDIQKLVEFHQEYMAGNLRPGYGSGVAHKTLGQQFTELDGYNRIKDTVHSDGYEGVRLSMAVKSLWEHEKALSSDTGSAGSLIEPFRRSDLVTLAQRRLRIRDLLPARPIDTNSVEYVEETGFTNEAAPVAETTEKPESDLVYELKETPVRTLAHWIRASRQVLSDAQQLRTRIDQQLLYGLEFVVENQILYGSGIGENLQGIMTHSDIQTYNMVDDDPTATGTDTRIDAIRRAMTLVELAHYEATGVVVHPTDWEVIELTKDNENRYIWIVVTEGGVQRLFRLPVVVTPAIEAGESLLGAFDLGGMLWDREQANIRVSDQHSDFFIHNMVAILGELRLALEISRPESFVNISFESEAV